MFRINFSGITKGRFGNQLAIYLVLTELQKQLGMKAFINKDCRNYMESYFDVDTISLPAISDAFCNYKDVLSHLQPFNEHFHSLVNNEEWRYGKLIEFYPITAPSSKNFHLTRHRYKTCVFPIFVDCELKCKI